MENTQDYQDYQDYRAEILGIVRSNASPGIMRNKLEDYHENDLADVFPDLSVAERRKLCRILNLDMLADIFEYIDEKQAAEYLDEMDVRKAAAILSRMETDAVVDVLRMIPKEKRALLLELMDDEARKDMAVIAAFDDEEIGSRMTTNYIEIRENLTVKQAMTELVSQAAKNDNISTIFMVTADHTFYGAMDLKDLITARQDTRLDDLQVLRFFMLSAHYRSPLNFSAELMEASKNGLERIINATDNLKHLLGAATVEEMSVEEKEAFAKTDAYVEEFEKAMDDDFNTADAIAAIFDLVKYANTTATAESSKEYLQSLLDRIVKLGDVLGLILDKKEELLDADIEKLIEERQAARKAKDFARADAIRDELLEKGIILKDTREGVQWKKA